MELGTALVAPARQYTHKIRECQLSFTVDEIGHRATVCVKKESVNSFDEWADVKSNHPDSRIPVTAFDPVFVNPNSFEPVKVVLRRVVSAARVKRYHPKDPSAREWLSVTMDGLPYLLCREVVESVHICSLCSKEVLLSCGKEDLLNACEMHTIEEHIGQQVNYIKGFDWALIRIGKLHMEMNMARTFIDIQWNIYFSLLAHEAGFVSEAAHFKMPSKWSGSRRGQGHCTNCNAEYSTAWKPKHCKVCGFDIGGSYIPKSKAPRIDNPSGATLLVDNGQMKIFSVKRTYRDNRVIVIKDNNENDFFLSPRKMQKFEVCPQTQRQVLLL